MDQVVERASPTGPERTLEIGRIGWVAALALCTALYLLLHLKVHAVQSDVIRAERQIVRLEPFVVKVTGWRK